MARGTTVSNRAVAWENLLDASRYQGPLSVNPLGEPRPTSSSPRNPEKEEGPPPVHVHKVRNNRGFSFIYLYLYLFIFIFIYLCMYTLIPRF